MLQLLKESVYVLDQKGFHNPYTDQTVYLDQADILSVLKRWLSY